MKAAARRTLVLVLLSFIIADTIGGPQVNIATVLDGNGDVLGPYIVKPFHEHDYDNPVAAPLDADDEGSGEHMDYDDTEGGDDSADSGLPINTLSGDIQDNKQTDPPTEFSPLPIVAAVQQDSNDEVKSSLAIPITNSPLSSSPVAAATTKFDQGELERKTTVSPVTSSRTPMKASTVEDSGPNPTASANETTCHDTCVKLLRAATMQVKPNMSMVRMGDSLTLMCQVAITDASKSFQFDDIQLRWVFVGENPPASECSLDQQEYLSECEGFASLHDWQDRNTTHLTTALTLTALMQRNTGTYHCQVRGHCCGAVPQHLLQRHVVVWEANYTTELLIMTAIAAGLTLMLIAGLIILRKRNAVLRYNYSQVVLVPTTRLSTTMSGKVVHLALQKEDSDEASFSSFDDA